jgi:hypothetical protein
MHGIFVPPHHEHAVHALPGDLFVRCAQRQLGKIEQRGERRELAAYLARTPLPRRRGVKVGLCHGPNNRNLESTA